MSAIVIGTEKSKSEDIKQKIKEGGGSTAAVGPQAVVEKTQAALKVANEAKQLNLRLKGQNQNIKRKNSTTTRNLQVDNIATKPLYKDKNNRCLQEPVTYENKRNISAQSSVFPLKCGEIFVTYNAKKWTFVCTHCQKTTRDIGEFVCHIKFKHMNGQYSDDDDNNGNQEDLNQMSNSQEDSYNNQDQDYFDCTNYLDVNVHTEADELPNDVIKNQTNLKTCNKGNRKDDDNSRIQKGKCIVNASDDDEGGNEENPDGTQLSNELLDYEIEDDEDGVEMINDDNEEMDDIEDNHLAFLRSNSTEDTMGDSGISGKSGGRKYRSHVRGKAYCNLCDKTFQYYSLYRNHMIKHSNITPYKCQYCSKAFKSKQAIRYHMNTHTKEIQYKCPLCPITYGTENQFITHVLNHENDTCFPCMVCAKILKSDQERDEHLETHTEERPYGCEFCNKRFRQKHHLSNHLKLHCQYRCDFCREEFSSTQTQRRPYACPTCEEYPDIRIQVEKQRSKSLNNPDVNPLEIPFENITQEADTECVDLAETVSDEESETSTSILGGVNLKKRVTCKYCTRSYKHNSALNYHMRQKHPHIWREIK